MGRFLLNGRLKVRIPPNGDYPVPRRILKTTTDRCVNRFVRQLLREPLVRFVVAGSVLFAAYALVRGPGATARRDDRRVGTLSFTLRLSLRNAFGPVNSPQLSLMMTDDESRVNHSYRYKRVSIAKLELSVSTIATTSFASA
jgi:hypothetical protein